MDTGADHDATRCHLLERLRNQRSHWRKDERTVERGGRSFVRKTRPRHTHVDGESARVVVSRSDKGVDLTSAVKGHLGDDVGRCAESIDPHAPTGPSHAKGAVPNQTGTQ